MRLRQIEVFHAVYANGSISAAARALNVSQPAVSKVLRHSETQLGIKLFNLVRGRLVPTDEAHAFFREVDDVFHRISSLQATARNLRSSGAGYLRIGVVPSLGLEAIPAAVAAYRQKHAGVTFEIKTIHHSDFLRSLYERECDIAFGYDPHPHPRLALRKLATAELAIVAPAGSYDRRRSHLSFADLENVDLIGVSGSGPVGATVAKALSDAGIEVREVASVDTFYIAAALARNGSGVAVVDEFTACAMSAPSLDVFRFEAGLSFGIYSATLEDRPMSKLAKQFVDQVKATLMSHDQLAPSAQP